MGQSRLTAAIGAVIVGGLLLTSCSQPGSYGSGDSSDGGSSSTTITVGSANFTESEILANIYASALKDSGYKVQEKLNIGSREVYIPALTDKSIDLIPDYSGNLLSYLDSSTTARSAEEINKALPGSLKAKGLAMGTPASAEDKDSVVVTSDTASSWSLSSIGDLASHNSELSMGGAPEFKTRAVGLPGLKKNYGVVPSSFTTIADGGGPATVAALKDGKVKAANIYTTSPDIPANNFVVLKDPKNNFPAQNVTPVFRDGVLDAKALKVVNAVSAQLTTKDLTELNSEVTGSSKMEPSAAAEKWLKSKGLAK